MNVDAAIKDVILRIVKGERVRVKLAYKDEVFSIMQKDYAAVKIYTESEDDQYAYIRKVRNAQPEFTPEAMAMAVHDCNGNPVKTEQGVVTGYGTKGQIIADVTSTKCLAKQIIYVDAMKNEYYIGTNRMLGLFMPDQVTDQGRAGWIRCNQQQFHVYLTALQTGQTFPLRQLKDELRIS